jgi:hypothetical protein
MIDQDSSEEDHIEYEFVSNLPPCLQDCKGFSGIQVNLKVKEGFSKKEQHYQIPGLEPDPIMNVSLGYKSITLMCLIYKCG